MKKLVFTAMAIVAFSGVSMAGNLIKGDVKKAIIKKTLVKVSSNCLLAKFVAYNDARAAGFSIQDATAMSYSVYFTCMGLDPISQ